MKKRISLVLAVLMLLSSVFVIDFSALAADGKCINVKISVTENYNYSNEVLSLVNQERVKNGKTALQMDKSLLESAMVRAAEIVAYYSHTRPNGEDCFSINPMIYGENIAIGQVDPQDVMNSWMNSQGHRENILRDGYESIGIGCVEYKSRFYWVQVFGYDYATPVMKSGTTSTIRSIEILLKNIELKNNTDYIASDDKYPNGYAANILAVNCGWSYVNYDFDLSLLDFQSSDPSVFTVDSNGWINLKKSGQATLTAVLKADKSISVSREIYVSVALEAPTAKYVVNSDCTFTITWNKVTGADKYEIYFSNDNGKIYKYVTTTDSTSLKSGKAPYGINYKYKIRAVNSGNNTKSEYCTVNAVNNKYLVAPTATYAVNTDRTLTVSWNKVTGADKYEVYYSSDGGKTYNLKTTTTATSVKSGQVAYGVGFRYKVRAINSSKGLTSAYSNVVNAVNNKYLATPTAKYTVNSDCTFTITWNKITGADKYEIYFSNDNGKTYKYVIATDSTSLKSGKAPYGINYKYKIRAVNSKNSIKSAYCTVNAVNNKKLVTPSANLKVNTDGTFTISWGKVTGATKYEIYMYDSAKNQYKLSRTLTGTSVTTTKGAVGVTYKYKVRAITSENASATSDFSAVVTGKR